MFDINGYINEFGGSDGTYFSRNLFLRIGSEEYDREYAKFKKKYKNTDIYKCVYAYDSMDINKAKLYGPLYFDLDGDINSEQGFEQLRKDVLTVISYFVSIGIRESDIDLYFSGAKGFHIILAPELLGIEPSEELNGLYKAWACYFFNTYKVFSLDLRIYDRKRLLRIPGSINAKTKLYKIKITPEYLRNTTGENLLRRAANVFNSFGSIAEKNICPPAARFFYAKSKPFFEKNENSGEVKPIELPKEKQKLLPCVEELLKTSVAKGNRNNLAVMLASGFLQSGYDIDETTDILTEWNGNNEPPMPASEVLYTVRSAYAMLNSGKKYGCSTFREHGFCSHECRLGEK